MNLLNNCDCARHNQFYVRKKGNAADPWVGIQLKATWTCLQTTGTDPFEEWIKLRFIILLLVISHIARDKHRYLLLPFVGVYHRCLCVYLKVLRSTLNNSIYFYLILCCDYKIHFLSFVLSLSSVYICLSGWMYIWFICVFSSVEMMRVHKSMCSLLFANDFFFE